MLYRVMVVLVAMVAGFAPYIQTTSS